MDPLTPEKLAANAYRTLGLSASASQPDIEAAARRMRIWPDPARIPPTPWDLPHLGPIARTRNDLQQAVARLTEPASRAEERVLWYLGPTPPASSHAGAEPGELCDPSAAPDSGAYLPDRRHDAALAALHAVWEADPHVTDTPAWQRVIDQLDELATAHDLPAWLARAEADGQFEKRASPAEIRAALTAAPAALAAALVPRAQAALDRGDLDAGARVASLLRVADPALLRDLVDRIEDAIVLQCRELDRDLRAVLRTLSSNPQSFYNANFRATHAATTTYNARVAPALLHLHALAADDEHRLPRVDAQCGELLELIGTGWEWSGQFEAAEAALAKALELVRGSQAEARVRRNYERCAALAATARAARVTSAAAAAAAYRPTAGRYRRPPAVNYAAPVPAYTPPRKPAAVRSAVGNGVAAVVIAIIIIIRALITAGNQASTPPSAPSWNPAPRYNDPRPPAVGPGNRDVQDYVRRRFDPTSPDYVPLPSRPPTPRDPNPVPQTSPTSDP